MRAYLTANAAFHGRNSQSLPGGGGGRCGDTDPIQPFACFDRRAHPSISYADSLRRSGAAAQFLTNEYASRWFIWEYVLHSTSVRADPAELDRDDPHPEQVLAELDAPPAEAIGCGITRLKLDCSLGKHFDLLPSVSLASRVNHMPRSKYSNFSTLRDALCAASRSHVHARTHNAAVLNAQVSGRTANYTGLSCKLASLARESESSAGLFVMGWKSRESLAVPVAENRDAKTSSHSLRLRPVEPLRRNH
jgi:hypothetical protein